MRGSEFLVYHELHPSWDVEILFFFLNHYYGNWQNFTELEYLLLGLVSALPSFLIPMLVVGKVHH